MIRQQKPYWVYRRKYYGIKTIGRIAGVKLLDKRPWYGRFKFIDGRNVTGA